MWIVYRYKIQFTYYGIRLEIYEPNLAAFRSHVQKMYLETDASDPWPDGVLDKINSLGN